MQCPLPDRPKPQGGGANPNDKGKPRRGGTSIRSQPANFAGESNPASPTLKKLKTRKETGSRADSNDNNSVRSTTLMKQSQRLKQRQQKEPAAGGTRKEYTSEQQHHRWKMRLEPLSEQMIPLPPHWRTKRRLRRRDLKRLKNSGK